MLNQSILVGRIVKEIELQEEENGRKVANIVMAIPRSYKNAEGEYDTDFIPIILYSSIAENTAEYCKKGDLIGVKGRLQNNNEVIVIVAEKVTFLSSSRERNED